MNILSRQQDVTSLVLVVDDDLGMRRMLRQQMETQGYQVIEANNGKQALSTYRQHHPDVVLLDVMMPVMDGFTCCRKLLALDRERPPLVLMTSMLNDESSITGAFEAGATDYVTKPINWTILRQRVQRLIQQSRLIKQLHQYNFDLEDYAIARNATIREQTVQLYKALELESTLKRITDKVRDTLNEAQVLQAAVQELAEALHMQGCQARVYDED